MVDLSALIDVDSGRVSGEIFASEEIYQRELTHLWTRTWVFLAHESMVPKAGSYWQSYIGEDPIVVVRLQNGSITAFMNQCRHRGMRICRADRGVAKSFMCSFHGWTYDIDGRLLAIPHEEYTYPDDFDKTQLSARRVTRLANYKGFVFGCWDPDAPDFEEYLGSAAFYLDAYIDRYDEGMEAIAIHKWVLPANWKFNVEQPTSDMQHSEITHMSAAEVLNKAGVTIDRSQRPSVPEGRQFFAPYGHGGAWMGKPGEEYGNTGPALLAWEHEQADQIAGRLGTFRNTRAHMNVFPNFMLLGNQTFRVTHPRGVNEMEIWSWAFAPKGATEEVKDAIRMDVMRTFSPGGMFEQDDAENWEEMQRILRGHMARINGFTYNMRRVPAELDADGYPGLTTPHVYSDNAALNMYGFYRDVLTSSNWSELKAMRGGA